MFGGAALPFRSSFRTSWSWIPASRLSSRLKEVTYILSDGLPASSGMVEKKLSSQGIEHQQPLGDHGGSRGALASPHVDKLQSSMFT